MPRHYVPDAGEFVRISFNRNNSPAYNAKIGLLCAARCWNGPWDI